LEDPKLLNASRIRRIARGSGTQESEVRELIRQYDMMKKFIRAFSKGRGARFGPWARMIKTMTEGGKPPFGAGEKGPGKGS
jgi:signal recognition particle subunit SRP54